NRSSGVDDAMRCLGSELQSELSSGCSHGDILPVGSRAGLSGVYFPWGASGAGPAPRRHLRRTLHGIASLLGERHRQMRDEDPELGPLPERVYLGLVHGIRALVCESLQDDPGASLLDLLPDVRRWITVTVDGARRTGPEAGASA
ncbi:MAG: hypothetical protein ACYDD6_12835, partial [Acidimicrobiales bacterium]